MVIDKFVIMHKLTNVPIGENKYASGYPVRTTDSNFIRYWNSREEAEKYLHEIFKNFVYSEEKNYEVVNCQIRIGE